MVRILGSRPQRADLTNDLELLLPLSGRDFCVWCFAKCGPSVRGVFIDRSRQEQQYASRFDWDLHVMHSRTVSRNCLSGPSSIASARSKMSWATSPGMSRNLSINSTRFPNSRDSMIWTRPRARIALRFIFLVLTRQSPSIRYARRQLNNADLGTIIRRRVE